MGSPKNSLSIGFKAGRSGRVVSMSECYVGGLPIKSSIVPLLKHAYGEAGCQEVSRCHTRGESQGMYITYASAKCE